MGRAIRAKYGSGEGSSGRKREGALKRRTGRLYSCQGAAKAVLGGSSVSGMAFGTKPDMRRTKPRRGRGRRALNLNEGTAENGRPLVNANCPSN